MNPKDTPPKEIVAATDEFFEQEQALPLEPVATPDEATPAQPPAVEEIPAPAPEDPRRPKARIGDYLRDLQHEYDGEQEKGKIDLLGPET
jgi:hypothetical protein